MPNNPETINKLDMVKAHKLVNLMLSETEGFTARKQSFANYAEFASTTLGFEVTKMHVQTRVKEFGIPAGEPVHPAGDLATLAATVLAQAATIDDITTRLAILEGWVKDTFPTRGLQRVV